MDKFNWQAIQSPILLRGNEKCAYRDPTAWYEDGIFHLYFTYVDNCPEGPFLQIGKTSSRDLIHFEPVKLLTPRDKSRNYSSPGNIFRYEGSYYMTMQTYCRENGEKYGNGNSRIYLMRSQDLEHWEEPVPLLVHENQPLSEQGRMIDPYIVQDRKDGKFWCFYKQNGVSYSCSQDLKNWKYGGHTESGENVCVLPYEAGYLIFHSPQNGIGILYTEDLKTFRPFCPDFYLGQPEWEWARGRITAAFVLDLKEDPRFGKYLMFFHGSGPEDESVDFDRNASLGVCWSDDLLHWQWPGK
ncbi:MAG: family 43 glycosylhydrolase [Candidatus Merdivicinus sp.]